MDQANGLSAHVKGVLTGERKFQNVFESLNEMLREGGVQEATVNGRQKYEFNLFRTGAKPIVGMHDEIMGLASFIKQAAQGGKADELAFVMIGEAGNGKTYLAEFLMAKYREHTLKAGNRRYTFKFTGLTDPKFHGAFGRIPAMESQTFEDPMLLALNLDDDIWRSLALSGMSHAPIGKDGDVAPIVEFQDRFSRLRRPLGADTDHTLGIIKDLAQSDKDLTRLLAEHVEIVPVRISPTSGVLTGKYAPKDKITASADDLLGKLDITRQLLLGDQGLNHPYRFNLRQGALARAGGGGIHFADELFKNKEDLIKIYLGVIQNRVAEMDGMKWPLDMLIIATSNHSEYQEFASNKVNAPVLDRCHPCYVGYCTNRHEQRKLTEYALGNVAAKTTFMGERFHIDPHLVSLFSDAAVLTRLPDLKKLERDDIEIGDLLRLSSGESANGTATPAKLAEIVSELATRPDFRERFGMTGLSQRALERAFVILEGLEESNRDRCLHAQAGITALERAVRDDPVLDADQKRRYIEQDFEIAHDINLMRVNETVFNAYRDDPKALAQHVLQYVNLVVLLGGGEDVQDGQEKLYTDPLTKERRRLKVDMKFVKAIDERMGIRNEQERQKSHQMIRNAAMRRMMQPTSDDLDAQYSTLLEDRRLVNAVTDYVLKSDVNGASTLAGALSDLSNEPNKKLRSRILDVMTSKLGHCQRCAINALQEYVAAQK